MSRSSNPHAIDIHLGRVIRRRRLILDQTQAQIAALVGIRHQQVAKYEVASNGLSARMLWKFSRALRLPIADFFAGFDADAA